MNTVINKIKSEIQKLFNTGFFHIFGSSVINKILALASGIILVRIIPKSEYGVYTYANNILGFFLLLQGFAMASGFLQAGSETKDRDLQKRLYSYSLKYSMLFNLILAAAIVAYALFIPMKIDGAEQLLLLMCLTPFFTDIQELQKTDLRIQEKNKSFSFANTISSILSVITACSFSWFFKAEGLVISRYVSGALVAVFILCIYKIPVFPKAADIDKKSKKVLLGVGGISMLNNGLSKLMYLLDVFILGICVPDSNIIASYKVATQIPTALAFIPLAIATYLYPTFARNRGNKKWLMSTYKKTVGLLGLSNVLLVSILVIFAEPLIHLFFGTQYLDAVPCFRILCINYLISGTFRILSGNLLVTQRKLQFNLWMCLFMSVMNTCLNVILINIWGSVGAAVATVITTSVSGFISTLYLIYIFKTGKPADIKE